MPTYICSDCNKSFINKFIYSKHITRKFSCKKEVISSLNKTIPNKINEITSNLDDAILNPNNSISNPNESNSTSNECDTKMMCCYCLTIFSSKCNLYRHMRLNCKVKKQEDNKKEEIYHQLLKEMKELKEENREIRKELDEIKASGKTINNNNPKNCNIHNGDNNNIVIVAHGREDLDKIDVKYILEALKRGLLKELVSLKRD